MSDFMDKLRAQVNEKENKEEGKDAPSTKEHPIVEQLKDIPDRHAVNPPPVEEVEKKEELEEKKEEPKEEAKEEEKKEKRPPQVCPTCGKEFKHLSRHKCKGVSKPIVTSTPIEEHDFASGKGEFKVGEEPSTEPEVNYVQTDMGDDYEPPTVTFTSTSDPVLSLYIDALPLDEDYEYLIDFLEPVIEAVEKENNVEHWSLIEYSKGCGMLATRLERYIEYKKPTGIIYLDSSTKEGRACKEVLRKHARRVVQGLR